MPRFKRRSSAQSAYFVGTSFSAGEKLKLARIGEIKVKWSRALPTVPSSVTLIKESSGRYFASFVVEVEPALLTENGQSVGIDLGITTFATLSTGEKITPHPNR